MAVGRDFGLPPVDLALASLPGRLAGEALQPNIPVALFFVATLTICNLLSLWFAHVAEQRHQSRDRERLIHLYGPLNALFLTQHIAVSTAAMSPRLRHRLENAWEELGSYRRRSRRVKRAWRALFDKQRSYSAEVEYGGEFPLDKIVELVRQNTRYAGPELQDLINHADRSHYEEYDRALMTNAEYALFEHIDSEHRRLSIVIFRGGG